MVLRSSLALYFSRRRNRALNFSLVLPSFIFLICLSSSSIRSAYRCITANTSFAVLGRSYPSWSVLAEGFTILSFMMAIFLVA